jgi:hypothetical protein
MKAQDEQRIGQYDQKNSKKKYQSNHYLYNSSNTGCLVRKREDNRSHPWFGETHGAGAAIPDKPRLCRQL